MLNHYDLDHVMPFPTVGYKTQAKQSSHFKETTVLNLRIFTVKLRTLKLFTHHIEPFLYLCIHT